MIRTRLIGTKAFLGIPFLFFSMISEAQQVTVSGKQGVVVSVDKYASQVGIDILKAGGNAIDAAVATAFALAVTHPFAGNIGGGGFMLIKLENGEEIAIDYRETAPKKATPTMFLKPDGTVDQDKSNFGYLVAGVPGTVKGLETAWQKHGDLPWKVLLQPAIKLAQKGIYLNKYDARELAKNKAHLARYPESKKVFFKNETDTYNSEDLWKQPDLAKTLKSIARNGSKAFYHGRIASKMASDFKRNGGLVTKADLRNYEAKVRKPLKGTFNGYEIIGMPPPSSGGVCVQEMLNILENVPLNKKEPLDPQNIHNLIEAMRYVFLDRTKFLGDPDFVEVPVDKLTSKRYGKLLAKEIKPDTATSSENLTQNVSVYEENMETTHFSVADKYGNVVSNTYTLEEAFGSKAVVKGLGFLLNNEMHDFNINPNQVNMKGGLGGNPNGIAPRKRMLSSMSPTIVLKDGKPILATGSPGGRTIVNTVMQMILGTTYYNLSLEQTMRLPRLSHHWMPDVVYVEKGRWDEKTLKALRQKGHQITEVDFLGDAQSIYIDPKTRELTGVSDDRRAGWAEGY